MSRITQVLVVAVLFVALLRASSALARSLIVAEWNLECFPGRSLTPTEQAKRMQMESAQKVLKQLNPDIFLAVEIRDWDSFEKLISVVPKLQVHTVSAFRTNERIGGLQAAIASSFPANSTWSEPWRRTEANPPRGLVFAALALSSQKLLFVYVVHLKSNSTTRHGSLQDNFARREDSANQLVAHVADMEKAYRSYRVLGTIIGGDFNTNLDNPEWKREKTIPILEETGFYSTWTGVAPKDRLTWKGTGRLTPRTLDWFLTKGLGKPTASLWKAAEDASDHEPVVLKVDIPDLISP